MAQKEIPNTNESFMLFGKPPKGVYVEGPGADQCHYVNGKTKGQAVDTHQKKIKPLGEQDGR